MQITNGNIARKRKEDSLRTKSIELETISVLCFAQRTLNHFKWKSSIRWPLMPVYFWTKNGVRNVCFSKFVALKEAKPTFRLCQCEFAICNHNSTKLLLSFRSFQLHLRICFSSYVSKTLRGNWSILLNIWDVVNKMTAEDRLRTIWYPAAIHLMKFYRIFRYQYFAVSKMANSFRSANLCVWRKSKGKTWMNRHFEILKFWWQ